MDLNKLVEVGKQGAEFNCIEGELIPVLMMDTPNGLEVVGVMSPDLESREAEKQYMESAIKGVLRERKATGYVHIAEGWGTTFVEASNRVQGQIRDLPPEDRYDMAIVTAIEKGNPNPVGYIGVIDTLPNGKRKLRKWEQSEQLIGRMVITEW